MAYSPGAYVATDVEIGPALVVPALRVDHFSKPDQAGGDTIIQPRLTARWNLTQGTTLEAGAGMYSKPPLIYQQRDGFGNDAVETELSNHYSLGFEQTLSEALSLEAVGFYNHLYHQVVYNRANPQGPVYNYDYTESAVDSGPNLPIVPTFGVNIGAAGSPRCWRETSAPERDVESP